MTPARTPSPEAVWLWLYRNAQRNLGGPKSWAAEADEAFKEYMERFGP